MARYPAWPLLLLPLLLSACVSPPAFQPTPNAVAHKRWQYQLRIDPPLPASEVRVDVLYSAGNTSCPVGEVGFQIDPHEQGQNLRFDLLLDQFQDSECDWRANQIWIGLGQDSGYATRFSLPIGSAPQVRWCRLNPQHGACMAKESDIRAYQIPGNVHRVMILRGE
ncbi:hypothetical protein CEK62_07825 [Alcanivorax sp. N3-2A]|nr:hypothetical protein CEK62_07825 [Alcanivorax sp. N3-2A]|tara:strand:- start:2579 stop:3076 length:498 start_codon:yes stop_codon:yes gene_type:complete